MEQTFMGKNRGDPRRGNSLLEFTLVGIPLIFILIATFEMSRGMWMYHTLAYAVKSGARYTVVHGQNCSKAPNACTVTISQIASRVQWAGPGLSGDEVTLTFTAANGSATTCLLKNCIANYGTSAWPPSSSNAPGQDIRISGIYPFKSTMLMFWPGAGAPTGAMRVVGLSADSREVMQY
jgi:Flp pilus assembly protein TadG